MTKTPKTRMLRRQVGWEDRLSAVLMAYASAPFAWGSKDCLTQVADACEALTGHNPMGISLRRYSSEEAALALLRRRGCTDVGEALARTFEEVPASMVRRGDCGTVEIRGTVAAVVVYGAEVFGRHERGAFRLPAHRLTRAFKVG